MVTWKEKFPLTVQKSEVFVATTVWDENHCITSFAIRNDQNAINRCVFLFFSIFKVAGFQTQFFLDEIQNFYFNFLLFFLYPFLVVGNRSDKDFFSFIIHQIVSFMFPGSCCVVTKNSFFTSDCLCHDSYGNKWVALYCLYITPENILQNKRKRSGHSLWIAQKSSIV